MRKLAFFLVLMAVIGCSQPDFKTYVKADRQTFNAVTPDYIKWLDESSLEKDKKERRYRLIESWKKRLESAEKTNAE